MLMSDRVDMLLPHVKHPLFTWTKWNHAKTHELIFENNCKEEQQLNPLRIPYSLSNPYLLSVKLLHDAFRNKMFIYNDNNVPIHQKSRAWVKSAAGLRVSGKRAKWTIESSWERRSRMGEKEEEWATKRADVTWVTESGPVHDVDLLLLSSLVRRLVWPIGRLQGNGPYRDPKP